MWYSLNEMGPEIQEVVNRSDWASGHSLSVILRGTGSQCGRKFVRGFDGSAVNAPGGAAGGAVLSAAPDKEQAPVKLAQLNTTSPRVVGDALASTLRPLAFVPPSGKIWRSYYYAGVQRIAVQVEGDPTPANNGVFYLLSDHLGSTSVTTDASGNKVAELRYYPYGQTRYGWNVTPTSYRFTGQRSDEDSMGLYFFNARYYDQSVPRSASSWPTRARAALRDL